MTNLSSIRIISVLLLLVLSLSAIAQVSSSSILQDAFSYYEFNDKGDKVLNKLNNPKYNLNIEDVSKVEWLTGGGLKIISPTRIGSLETGSDFSAAAKNGNAASIEVYFTPESALSESGRIVTISSDIHDRNLSIRHGLFGTAPTQSHDVIDVRLRVKPTSGGSQIVQLTSDRGIPPVEKTHLVITVGNGSIKMYVNGTLHKSANFDGTLKNWKSQGIYLGDEISGGTRTWLGTYHHLSLHAKELTTQEVQTLYNEARSRTSTSPSSSTSSSSTSTSTSSSGTSGQSSGSVTSGSTHTGHNITTTSSGEFTQVDPTTNTDNIVNSFLKEQVNAGFNKIAAAGTWWGPTSLFFVNQIWVVERNIKETTYDTDTVFNVDVTCLLPTSSNGPNQNTLTNLHASFEAGGPAIERNFRVSHGRFVTMSGKATTTRLGHGVALRTKCHAKEGKANLFGDGTPLAGRRIVADISALHYFRSPTAITEPNFNNANALKKMNPLPDNRTITALGWYEQDYGYVYSVLEKARDAKKSFTAYELIGANVSGTLELDVYPVRGAGAQESGIHHLELRVEKNDEDYTVMRHFSADSVLTNIQNQRNTLTVDTTKFENGLHIISIHDHIIDHHSTNNMRGKQFAVELKIPMFFQN